MYLSAWLWDQMSGGNGKPLRVNEARPREDRPRTGGFGGNRSGGFSGNRSGGFGGNRSSGGFGGSRGGFGSGRGDYNRDRGGNDSTNYYC